MKSHPKYRYNFACILVLLLAFALRMWDVDARSLWFDEAVEYWSATVSLSDLPQAAVSMLQPPLYSFLLHFWSWFGTTAIWLRMLSISLSLLSVSGMVVMMRAFYGVRGGVIAGLIMAVLPSEIRYAQEVGEYALLGCGLVLSLFFLVLAVRRGDWKFWLLWGVFSIVGVYSHYGATLVVFASSLVVWAIHLLQKNGKLLARQSMIAGGSILFALPLVNFVPQQFGLIRSSVTPASAFSLPTEIEKFIVSIGDTFLFQMTGWPYSPLPKWLGLVIIGLIFILYIIAMARSSIGRLVFCWLLVAYMVYYWVVRLGFYAHGVFGFRYALILSPFFVFAIAATFEQLVRWRQRWIATGLAGLFLVLSLYSLPNRAMSEITRQDMGWPETQDVREIVEYWMQHYQANASTYVYYGAVPAFGYYVRQAGAEAVQLPARWYAHCWKKDSPGYCRADNIFYGAWIRNHSPETKLESVYRTLGTQPPKLWIAFSHTYPGEQEMILKGLSAQYRVMQSYERKGASVYLLEQR